MRGRHSRAGGGGRRRLALLVPLPGQRCRLHGGNPFPEAWPSTGVANAAPQGGGAGPAMVSWFRLGSLRAAPLSPEAPCRSGRGVRGRQALPRPQPRARGWPKVLGSRVEQPGLQSAKWQQTFSLPRAESRVDKTQSARLAGFFRCSTHPNEAALRRLP